MCRIALVSSGFSCSALIASVVGRMANLILRRCASRFTSSMTGKAPVPVPITSRRHFQGMSSPTEAECVQRRRGTFWTVSFCACRCGPGRSRRHARKSSHRYGLNQRNSDITRVSKNAFEDGHWDKAVLSAFIEINDQVKKIVLQKTKKELDGGSLMNMAFSINSPIIKLTDLLNQAERDVQIGFMQIFAGSMTGIRNPHAHANLIIDASRGS